MEPGERQQNDVHHKQFKIYEPKQSEGDQKLESVFLSFQLTTFSISNYNGSFMFRAKNRFSFPKVKWNFETFTGGRSNKLDKRKMLDRLLASNFRVRDFRS